MRLTNIFKFQSNSINTLSLPQQARDFSHFKFQSDSINTYDGVYEYTKKKDFKFQSDCINTVACGHRISEDFFL